MENVTFNPAERQKIEEYFGKKPEDLTMDEFTQKHRELRAKYHPDKFEKYSDEIVRELALGKFKEIEELAEKLKLLLSKGSSAVAVTENEFGADARFAYNNLKIEIITQEKDLKYHLFDTQYRWLERGDKYMIKGTNASIIIEANHRGAAIGYNESIKMYLTFSETDSLEEIFRWLYERIAGRATSVKIGDNLVKVDYNEMLSAVKRKTILRLDQ